ncbi:MAG: hypothetical protein KGJ86_10410 [Chloroflexota bacterium]|nr:hypothetical protein [Chloroflexota bacterium]
MSGIASTATGGEWERLKPDEKLDARVKQWLSPVGVDFIDPEVRHSYQGRVRRFMDAVRLRPTDRIPVSPNVGFFPSSYANITPHEAMYDYDKLAGAIARFHRDFKPDSLRSSSIYGPGPMFDLLDYKLYRWPGHGLELTAPAQYVESEYMKPEEYDVLIQDPSGYFMRRFLPRIFGSLEGFQALGVATDNLNIGRHPGYFSHFAEPAVRAALSAMLEAGQAAQAWRHACALIDRRVIGQHGIPLWLGTAPTNAPFDIIGDTLRGTRGIMTDLFRRPERVLAAMERFVPLAIDMGVRGADAAGVPFSYVPLHKGAQGFMSTKDFERFYWPTLKALILGLVDQGIVPLLFVQGSYDLPRLEIIAGSGIPAGATVWLFDKTDMRQVKQQLGSWACIAGNVPLSLLQAGTPSDVRTYVKRLIDDVAQDGAFVLSTGAVIDQAKPENVHALIDAGLDCGTHR